jgi:hypothetical protein
MGNDSEFNKEIPAGVTALQARRTRDLVLDFFPPVKRAEPSANSLASIFKDFIGAADLTTRLDAFAELKDWTTKIAPSPAGKGVTRLDVVLALMESQAELLSRFKRGMREILTETSFSRTIRGGRTAPAGGFVIRSLATVDRASSTLGTRKY